MQKKSNIIIHHQKKKGNTHTQGEKKNDPKKKEKIAADLLNGRLTCSKFGAFFINLKFGVFSTVLKVCDSHVYLYAFFVAYIDWSSALKYNTKLHTSRKLQQSKPCIKFTCLWVFFATVTAAATMHACIPKKKRLSASAWCHSIAYWSSHYFFFLYFPHVSCALFGFNEKCCLDHRCLRKCNRFQNSEID